jgi:hypothetical protein
MTNRQFYRLEAAYFVFGIGSVIMWFAAVTLQVLWLIIIALVSFLIAMLCFVAVLIWDR